MKASEQVKKYHVVFKNKFVTNVKPEDVQRHFISKFKIPEKSVEKIFSGRRVRIKKGLGQQTALDLQDKLFQIGMLCDLELVIEQKPKQKLSLSQTPKKTQQIRQSVDDDDDDDDDFEADFDLSEILMQAETNTSDKNNVKNIVKIIKCHENKIIDIQYLKKNSKYVDTENHFCLAEHDKKSNAFFYFDDFIQGNWCDSEQKTLKTESLRINENLYNKKKRIYRHLIPDQAYVTLNNDLHTYYIRKKSSHYIPPQPSSKRPRSTGIKHIARSIVCHLMLIVLIGMFVSFEKPNSPEQKRFAKIAGNKIHDLQKLRKKQRETRPAKKKLIVQNHLQEKVAPLKKTTSPKKVKKNLTQTKPSPKRVHKNYIKKNNKQITKAKSGSHSSKGKSNKQVVSTGIHQSGNGGGNVGNVSTPDVNQKGILGMIKDTGFSLLNTEALAAVTQIDTVDVSGNFDNNTLKIGGIKGHLGDRKVQMPFNNGGGRVNTKGIHQVLRTGGGDGSGGKGSGARVGELAKGNTGNKAVKAMIRANFQQHAHQIQGGGMSRSAVKKVIDQHIDDITYCYEVALISDPSIVGKAVYEWRILMNGSVGDVHILNASIQNQEILGCIKKSIKTWEFPQPHRDQVLVSYPFVFDIVGF